MAYRLNVAAEDGASRSNLVDNRKMVVAPAFTWNLSPNTVLNYEAEFIRIRTPLDRGLVQVNGNVGPCRATASWASPTGAICM